jgi:hypothetical protein
VPARCGATVPRAGGSAAAGARVHRERHRQTQAPWSCDRTAQVIAAVQERKKPSDMRTSLAEAAAPPASRLASPLRQRDFDRRGTARTSGAAHRNRALDAVRARRAVT